MLIRVCKYCGTDITYKSLRATICGCRECTNLYDKERRNKPKEKRYCRICGCDITDLSSQRLTCLNDECIKQNKKNNYAIKLKIKKCDECGKEFEATVKQHLCETCRKEKKLLVKLKKITQEIICQDCGKLIKTIEKYYNGKNVEKVYGLCEECRCEHKKKFSEEASKRMRSNNPMKIPEIAKASGDALREKYLKKCAENGIIPHKRTVKKENPETIEETRLRMSINNPMKRREVVEKVKKTKNEKIKNGDIIYKKGVEHPLWRGNRTLNKNIRTNLRKWVRSKFESCNFTCQECGKHGGELQVHHIVPLQKIINDFLNEKNLTKEYLNSIEGTTEYINFIDEIVKYHNEHYEIGIVVCPECHNKLDKFYRRKTHDKKY